MHALTVAALVLSSVVPPPDPVTADIVTINGSGCPASSATISVSPDNSSFTLSRAAGHSAVRVEVGPNTPPVVRKGCHTVVRIRPPQGYAYAVGDSEFHGSARIGRGAHATVSAQHAFQGQVVPYDRVWRFDGPFDDDWSRQDHVDELVYHPCDGLRNLNLFLELRVARGTSKTTSHLIRDADEETYQLHWKRCGSN